MWAEWAEGQDIGRVEVLEKVAGAIGLDTTRLKAAIDSRDYQRRLKDNWAEALSLGVIGVPSFVVGDQIFWGNDRVDFLEDYLMELGLKIA